MKELEEKWRTEATTLEKYGDLRGAQLLRQVADDLRSARQAAETRTVSLREASRLSGMHEDSIGRLVRQRRLPNYGTTNRPRVRVSELPHKARPVAQQKQDGEVSDEVFRGIVASKFGGH